LGLATSSRGVAPGFIKIAPLGLARGGAPGFINIAPLGLEGSYLSCITRLPTNPLIGPSS